MAKTYVIYNLIAGHETREEDIKKIFDSKKVIIQNLENIIISGIPKKDIDVFFCVIDKMNNNIDEYLGGNND